MVHRKSSVGIIIEIALISICVGILGAQTILSILKG